MIGNVNANLLHCLYGKGRGLVSMQSVCSCGGNRDDIPERFRHEMPEHPHGHWASADIPRTDHQYVKAFPNIIHRILLLRFLLVAVKDAY